MEKKQYYNIKKRAFAEALNFLGFRYYKYTGDRDETIYGFVDNPTFREAMNGLLELRKEVTK